MLETPVKPAREIDREGVGHPLKRWCSVNARRAARGADAESIHAFKLCAADQGVLRAIDRWACCEFGTFTAAGVADELRPRLQLLGCRPVMLYFRGLALLLLGLAFLLRGLQRQLGARAAIWLTPPVPAVPRRIANSDRSELAPLGQGWSRFPRPAAVA